MKVVGAGTKAGEASADSITPNGGQGSVEQIGREDDSRGFLRRGNLGTGPRNSSPSVSGPFQPRDDVTVVSTNPGHFVFMNKVITTFLRRKLFGTSNSASLSRVDDARPRQSFLRANFPTQSYTLIRGIVHQVNISLED